jgi:hypothetical protein
VVLRPAGQDLLAEKGFLQGTLVEKVTADNPPEGLQAGDIIIDYDSVYDLVMAAYPTFGPINRLKNMARYGGKLVVLRGQKIITLVMEKP